MISTTLLLSALASVAVAGPLTERAGYTLKKTYDSTNFFSSFNFQNSPDKWNEGFAQYVDKATAQSSGLAKILPNKQILLRADNTSTVSTSSTGRKSIRLEGVDTFDNGLLVANFAHLPGNACGIWPAYWVLHDGATYSEIDIVEAVHFDTSNVISMYTLNNPCKLVPPSGQQMLGTSTRTDCYLHATPTAGCGVTAPTGTFGDSFNAKGGGVWALQVESNQIRVWYWAQGQQPKDIDAGNPNPDNWSTPVMVLAPGNCDIKTAFQQLSIIINITFCGDNAGAPGWSTWSGCSARTGVSTCEAYVAANPHAFDEAYFLINNIKLFQK